jgi:hypothetical protein
MKFARVVYISAAVYGLLLLSPLYFLIEKMGRDSPPPITHPEFFYGFLGVALLWQLVFLVIATNPKRYRPLMLIAILEKFVYTVPVVILYTLGRVHLNILIPALGDPVWGILFIIAFWRTPKLERA